MLNLQEIKKLWSDEIISDDEARKIRDVAYGLSELALEAFRDLKSKKERPNKT